MNQTRDIVSSRLLFGFALLAGGVLLTLGNLGLVDAWSVLRYWPVTIILWGVMRITGFCCARRPVWGTVQVIVGVYIQARLLFGGWFSSLDVLAVLLVIAGAWVLAGPSRIIDGRRVIIGSRLRRRRDGRVGGFVGINIGGVTGADAGAAGAADPGTGAGDTGPRTVNVGVDEKDVEDASERVSAFAILGNVSRKLTSQAFRGGDVGAVLGGVDLDLRGARLAGEEAFIDVTAFMGGVDMRVPDGWRISGEATTVLGSFIDKTRVPASDARVTLHVRGVAMLGAIEIKN